MRPINLDTEIVATRHDPITGDCFYTVERDGVCWTVKIHRDAFNAHVQQLNLIGEAAGRKKQEMLGQALLNAIQTQEPDERHPHENVLRKS